MTKYLFFFLSFILVAFGQPAWNSILGLISACCGFAIFWYQLLDISNNSKRFWLSFAWFASVQLVQLSWFISHPFWYIYFVLLFCAFLMGFQFGIIGLFITRVNLQKISTIFFIAALWTLLEWSRLFILSGLPFSPIGLTLTGFLYPLQMASLGGVFFLSFWVMLTNLFCLRLFAFGFTLKKSFSFFVLALFPYVFGYTHVSYHTYQQQKSPQKMMTALLVQTGFPVEEVMTFSSAEETRQYVLDQWKSILSTISAQKNHKIDLITLPEYVVPYGTYLPVYPYKTVKRLFLEFFGVEYLKKLPPLEKPFATYVNTYEGPQWLVTNAFFGQVLANIFDADVVIGLEDSLYEGSKKSETYSAAIHFLPGNKKQNRYEKRVLVPMGEYIPFSFCRSLAARYGIQGSFTCGKEAKIFYGKIPFSPSICYEETYGNIVREGKVKGAELLVNLTNDAWYPDSRLPLQHFEHARLRSVENGVPMVRACNTGITAAVDSLGRTVAVLGSDHFKDQWLADGLKVQVPLYHYNTLYAAFGNYLILLLCCALILFWLLKSRSPPMNK